MLKIKNYDPKSNILSFEDNLAEYQRVLNRDSKGYYVNLDNDKIRIDIRMLPKTIQKHYHVIKSSKTYHEGLEEVCNDGDVVYNPPCEKELYEHCLLKGYRAWAIWRESKLSRQKDVGYRGKWYTIFYYK